MKCIHCGKEAMMEIRLIPLDGKEEEIYLCQECMEKYFSGQGLNPSEEFSFFQEVLEKLLGGLLTEIKGNEEENSQEEEPSTRCPFCNSALSEILKKGKLGCEHCYETFSEKISEIITSCQGSLHHQGKVPRDYEEVMELLQEIEKEKRQIEEDIVAENYEHAAQVRDRILQLTAKVEKKRGELHADMEK